MILNIRHLSGSLAGRSQRVALNEGQTLRLGRGPENDIKFSEAADDSVSGTHAELRLEQGRLVIEDKRSANGTFVNGAPCPPFQKVAVPDGSRLRLARQGPEMQVTLEPVRAAAAAATATAAGAAVAEATATTSGKSVGRETLLREIDRARHEERDVLVAKIDEERGSRKMWFSLGLILVLLLLIGGIGGALWWNQRQTRLEAERVATAEREARERERNVWSEVERAVGPAVVHIRCRYRLRFDGLAGKVLTGGADGSGVLIRPGLILTARHVVEPWRYALASWDQFEALFDPKPEYDLLDVQFPSYQPIRATLVASSAEHDLALLQVQETSAPTVPTGKSNGDVHVTQRIAIMGYPGELGQYAVAVKNLSGAGDPVKNITEINPTFVPGTVAQPMTHTGDASHYLVFDGSVGPGNSGGPVVNDRGELIGIVALQFQREGQSLEVLGKRYATLLPMEAGNVAVSPDDIQTFLRKHGIL